MAKKKLVLEFEDGLASQYKKWTKEAVEKFVSLFPDFKDSFEIKLAQKSFVSKQEIEEALARSPNHSAKEVWSWFERQADGRYLTKNSIDWHILHSTENGKINLLKWVRYKENGNDIASGEDPLKISISKRPTDLGYGISHNVGGPCISASQCGNDESFFKSVVMHELGHSFMATHCQRQNTVDNGLLGMHCADADCVMYQYDSNFRNRMQRLAHVEKPFCSDCMSAMRNWMEDVLKLDHSQANQSQQQTSQKIKLQDLPMFKDMTPAELKTLHNYQRILREKNIQRSKQDQLFDMLRITASTRSKHNSDPQTQGSVVIDDKKLEAYTREDWNDPTKFAALQSSIYSSKREVRYPDPFTSEEIKRPSPEAKSVFDAQIRQGKLAKIDGKDYDDYWVRKYSQGYLDAKATNPNQEQHRFILNVNPSEDLFKKLDDFADKYNCLYKSPQLISWGHRLDTVVLYTSDNRIAEQQKELIKIASPHIRKERDPNTLDGTKLADGIFTAKEFDRNDISALADRAQQNNLASLADAIRKNLSKSTAHPLSLGEFLSYKEIIDNAEMAKTGNFNIIIPQKVNNTEQNNNVTVSNEPLKEEHQGTDRTFKKALREVFEPSARKEGSVYKEDIKANNYVAKITHKDGSVDHISASSATNLSLSGTDKDGNSRVPDMQRFRDIAEYTHRKNTFVNFGDIKTPEFKAKLMLACMEHEPPVAMRGQPKVNKEFLDSLTDTAVKKMLEDAINKDKKTKPQQQATVISQNILQGGR